MTLIAACATKDSVIVASDTLIGTWKNCFICGTPQKNQTKIFRVGSSVVAYAGHAAWAIEIKDKAIAAVASNPLLADVYSLKEWMQRVSTQFVNEKRKGLTQDTPISMGCPPEHEAIVEFLVCGISTESGKPLVYHVSSNWSSGSHPLQSAFVGVFAEYRVLFDTLYKADMSTDQALRLLNYCMYEAIGKSDRRFVDFPIHIWRASPGHVPSQVEFSEKDLDDMNAKTKALILGACDQI